MNIVPEDFDPLTWLLTFLTFDVAIVVVIVMDGKSRIKGTIELFSSASIGTSIVILFLTGMLSPCLMDRNGLHRFGLYPVHLGLGMHLGECQ